MENRSHGQEPFSAAPYRPSAGASVFTEPEVRRWPHPVEGAPPPESNQQSGDGMLHYIRCALSYQNQMLADIKALLEQIAADISPDEK